MQTMAERSLQGKSPTCGSAKVTLPSEGILAITKALLQSGVSYVGGYHGSPISHLMDVLAMQRMCLMTLGHLSEFGE